MRRATSPDSVLEIKRCPGCGESKPFSEFHRQSKDKFGLASRCKVCTSIEFKVRYAARDDESLATRWELGKAWRATNPDRHLRNQRRAQLKMYSLTLEDYDEMLEGQGGCCASCWTPEPGHGCTMFCVDHDHRCCPGRRSCGQCVRGLLCVDCNVGISRFNDDPRRLAMAARYLGGEV